MIRVKGMGTVALICALAGTALSGCATSGNPKDPIEGFNRAVFAFNDAIDSVAIKPVAKGYSAVIPDPVQRGVSNFFGNIADVFVGVNNVLQGKVVEGAGDFGRVLVNSTIGILGVMDVASDMGIEKHDEDFGQTFGRWGVGNGPYVVLPIFGPRTLRDTAGFVLDIKADPVGEINDVATKNSLQVVRLVDARAGGLSADKVIDAAALDRYSYVRDAYLQRRRSLIYDGSPPREIETD